MVELVAIKCRVIEGILENDEITPEVMDSLISMSQDISQLIAAMQEQYSNVK